MSGNLRAVQEHSRHADIPTTTIYTRLPDMAMTVALHNACNYGWFSRCFQLGSGPSLVR